VIDHATEQPIPDNITFTAKEWDTVMAGRAARLIAAGEMPSLEEFLTAVKTAVKGAK
jgi:hypothetical protein